MPEADSWRRWKGSIEYGIPVDCLSFLTFWQRTVSVWCDEVVEASPSHTQFHLDVFLLGTLVCCLNWIFSKSGGLRFSPLPWCPLSSFVARKPFLLKFSCLQLPEPLLCLYYTEVYCDWVSIVDHPKPLQNLTKHCSNIIASWIMSHRILDRFPICLYNPFNESSDNVLFLCLHPVSLQSGWTVLFYKFWTWLVNKVTHI